MSSHIYTKILVKKFLIVFVPFSILVGGILGAIYYGQTQAAKTVLKTNELRKVDMQAKVIAANFNSIVADLMVLSDQNELQKILEGVDGQRQALSKEFLSFSEYKQLYDQIRFLDLKGKEIVRVNFNQGKPSVVPEERLQVQIKRYWFNDTLRLNQGEVFISPFDLNIERGKVEQPLKPMIRFGTPIFDRRGEKRGIVVLNYLGNRLLDNFTQTSFGLNNEAMLLNANGYWLKGVKSEDEWGFMFPNRQDRTFGKTFPLAWKQISQTKSGQFQTSEGLFTFTTVYPLLAGQKSSTGAGQAFTASKAEINGNSYYWKIVSRVSPRTLSVKSNKLLTQLLLLYAGLVGVIGIGSWLLAIAGVNRQSAELELRKSETRLLELAERENMLKTRLSSQIRNSLDLDTILSTAVVEVRGLLQIDRCKFFWYEINNESISFELSHESCNPELLTPLGYYPIEKIEIFNQAIVQNQLLQVDNIATDSRLDTITRELLLNLGLTSLLAISIRTHSNRLGVLVCEHSRVIHAWNESEVELIQAVVDQLAIAIDQAQLYSQSRAATSAAIEQAEKLEQTLHELQQTQTQLIQNEKMSSLGQMVAGIAHEINNPVNFIHGNITHASEYTKDLLRLVQLYQQQYPNPPAEIEAEIEAIEFEFLQQDLTKLLNSMRVGTQRIREIVQSLRLFSRLDEAECKSVDIHEGIDSTLMILNHRLKAKPERPAIEVYREYGNLPLIECYSGQLNQVFMNILANAIDALEERTPEEIEQNPNAIYITTELLESETAVNIKIRDNGHGIPEPVKNRIFDPFFTTKIVGKGTGLGMSISYQIVTEKHGGTICCTSESGHGAEFWIQLPIQQNLRTITARQN